MRVQEGYRPKQKFSVSFYPDTFEKLVQVCKQKGIHRSNFIENAVLAALEDGGRLRPQPPSALRSSRDFISPRAKKRASKLLVARRPKK